MNIVKRINNRIAAWTLCCCILVAFTGCLEDDEPAEDIPVAYVSLYQGSPDAPGLDIEVDNNQINTGPFLYADYSNYLRFYTGARNLKFGPYSSSSVNIDTTVTFEAN